MAKFASQFSSRPLAAWIEDLQQSSSAEVRYRALLAVNSLSTLHEALHWCCHSLGDSDSGVRALAAKEVGEWKRRGDALPWADESNRQIGDELAARLTDEDPDVRFEAARALGRVNPQLTSARDVLLSLLDDEGTQPLMIAVVISALGERGDPDADALIPRFQRFLEHPQAEIRENIAAVVAKSAPLATKMVAEMVIALDDDEPIVRENAALALGQSASNLPDVIAALSTASTDDDEGVAAAAKDAHSRLTNGG